MVTQQQERSVGEVKMIMKKLFLLCTYLLKVVEHGQHGGRPQLSSFRILLTQRPHQQASSQSTKGRIAHFSVANELISLSLEIHPSSSKALVIDKMFDALSCAPNTIPSTHQPKSHITDSCSY